jgi:hypothetical protein
MVGSDEGAAVNRAVGVGDVMLVGVGEIVGGAGEGLGVEEGLRAF